MGFVFASLLLDILYESLSVDTAYSQCTLFRSADDGLIDDRPALIIVKMHFFCKYVNFMTRAFVHGKQNVLVCTHKSNSSTQNYYVMLPFVFYLRKSCDILAKKVKL